MTRHRKRLLTVLALVALLGFFALPPVYWRLIGTVRGEAFYQGRPVSYWRNEIAGSRFTNFRATESGRYCIPARRLRGYRWWLEECRNRLWPTRYSAFETEFAMPDGDPAELPVLVALLEDPSPKVRGYAALLAATLGASARPVVQPLRVLERDEAVFE